MRIQKKKIMIEISDERYKEIVKSDKPVMIYRSEVAKVLANGTPQETGHWIDNRNGTISCSNCHTWFHKDDRYPYMLNCPYCDAKMEEE